MKDALKDKPLVTVAMVTYNQEKYVSQAIASVLASSYEWLELVISDDNSTDGTWRIIQEFATRDPRIKAFRQEQNLMEYPNRNYCLQKASGEYVIYIDGDDMIYPHGLEFMVRMLHAFPECAMALMRWFKNQLFYPVVITPQQFFTGEYFRNGFLGTAFSNVLFRTQILRAAGGLSDSHIYGDDFIRYKIGLQYPSLLINDGLTWWRETPGQASQRNRSSLKGLCEPYQMKLDFLKEAPVNESLKAQARKNVEISAAKNILQLLKRGKLAIGLGMARHLGLFPRFLTLSFGSPQTLDPFAGSSPEHPEMLSWDKNPYAKDYQNP